MTFSKRNDVQPDKTATTEDSLYPSCFQEMDEIKRVSPSNQNQSDLDWNQRSIVQDELEDVFKNDADWKDPSLLLEENMIVDSPDSPPNTVSNLPETVTRKLSKRNTDFIKDLGVSEEKHED